MVEMGGSSSVNRHPVHLPDMPLMTSLLISGCAIVVWLIGYGMGYWKGVRDTINNETPKADHPFNGD
jgi:hypothetical protein